MIRLKDNVLLVGKIGEDVDSQEPKGISRLRNTKEYYEAVRITESIMKNAGLETRVDTVGNIIGTYKGTDPSLKTIALGSHLDTVLHGGIFDGNLGVQSAIECIYKLNENGVKLKHSVDIFGFNCEESSGLGGTFGSRAMFGLVDLNKPGFEEVLKDYGYTKSDIENAKVCSDKYKSYIELHIEQGGSLDAEKINIGIVTGIIGVTRFKITANGESNHAGTTKMEYRKDALVGMSKLIIKINELANSYGDSFVATVGMINVVPGAENVIPGKAEVILELRHMKKAMYSKFIEEIKEFSNTIENIGFEFEELIEKGSVECDPYIMDCIEEACKEEKVSYIRMPSGAGHDANPIAKFIPIGMIFVPSKAGISHSRFEWTEWEDVEKGANVLYKTLLQLDKL